MLDSTTNIVATASDFAEWERYNCADCAPDVNGLPLHPLRLFKYGGAFGGSRDMRIWFRLTWLRPGIETIEDADDFKVEYVAADMPGLHPGESMSAADCARARCFFSSSWIDDRDRLLNAVQSWHENSQVHEA